MQVHSVSQIYKGPVFQAKPSALSKSAIADLAVFRHHIYEYKTGIRNLFLTTEKAKYKDIIIDRLEKENIAYAIHDIANNNINIYFGAQQCVDVVKSFNNKNLRELSAEQDFILGIMLGYDRVKECERYLKIKNGIIHLGKQ